MPGQLTVGGGSQPSPTRERIDEPRRTGRNDLALGKTDREADPRRRRLRLRERTIDAAAPPLDRGAPAIAHGERAALGLQLGGERRRRIEHGCLEHDVDGLGLRPLDVERDLVTVFAERDRQQLGRGGHREPRPCELPLTRARAVERMVVTSVGPQINPFAGAPVGADLEIVRRAGNSHRAGRAVADRCPPPRARCPRRPATG